MRRSLTIVLCAASLCAQTDNRVVLVVDVDNAVTYRSDVTDYARRGADTGPTTALAARSFTDQINIGDIVAVNGKPARGLWTSRTYAMGFSPTPGPGSGIADAALGGTADCKWSFHDVDGRFIGAIFDGGYAPHGVTGGVGAFYGVRGQMGAPATPPRPDASPLRVASISEDPGRRRELGGGRVRIVFHLIPAERPEILAAYHSDFSLVTAEKPARPGESLILRAAGLGPLTPGTTPSGSAPFPDPPAEVNSPVEVTFGDVPGQVISKVGWPGETNIYRVDVIAPAGMAPGMAGIRMTAAWIPGGVFRLPAAN
jgi:hypothetical protein